MLGQQGPTILAVGADGGCLAIFSRLSFFLFFLPSYLSSSPWDTARYRLNYCLKEQNNMTSAIAVKSDCISLFSIYMYMYL